MSKKEIGAVIGLVAGTGLLLGTIKSTIAYFKEAVEEERKIEEQRRRTEKMIEQTNECTKMLDAISEDLDEQLRIAALKQRIDAVCEGIENGTIKVVTRVSGN